MQGITTCHVLECPNGRYTYAGHVPAALCYARPATTADVMGQRAYRGPDGGLITSRPHVFDTEGEAREFAGNACITIAD